ncbi:MAG: hypothetical protein ABIE22_01635 [archaeon]
MRVSLKKGQAYTEASLIAMGLVRDAERETCPDSGLTKVSEFLNPDFTQGSISYHFKSISRGPHEGMLRYTGKTDWNEIDLVFATNQRTSNNLTQRV